MRVREFVCVRVRAGVCICVRVSEAEVVSPVGEACQYINIPHCTNEMVSFSLALNLQKQNIA